MESDLIRAQAVGGAARLVAQAVVAPLTRAAIFLVATTNPGPLLRYNVIVNWQNASMQYLAPSQTENGWRELYLAALFEADRGKLEQRIAEAEKALVQRGRELFHAAGNNIGERRAIDNALSALHALRDTYQFGVAKVRFGLEAAR